jgi:hypothetical protein
LSGDTFGDTVHIFMVMPAEGGVVWDHEEGEDEVFGAFDDDGGDEGEGWELLECLFEGG